MLAIIWHVKSHELRGKLQASSLGRSEYVRCETRSRQTRLNERVDVQHKSLSPADDELIDAGDGMRPATQ